ncbi:type IV secretion system protein VirB9 [Granulicella aggregans]|uniref:Type IV secretion system protein VirB9 n=1 Tax=Granulicella aggregans TaxID=474949 RepID=A0A7W7ZKX5_9BACT|nr:TrbG/VirB9 family P-type conjugative transfer protein [Granulicella aggregans]MBB5061618.1 type IV secretion system protein VirB9 [Granulicella aggregans]
MKTSLIIAESAILALCAYAVPAIHAQQKAPRTIEVNATAAPPIIRACLNASTLLELPAEEKVATVFGGNTDDWIFNAGHVASRFISAKPKAAAAKSSTNVHIISDHGNDYTLELREVSADPAGGCDSTVFLTQTDKEAQKKIAEAPVFIPAAEVKETEDRLEREVSQAKATAAADKKTAETAQENYQSTYPSSLHFDYRWDQGKARALGVRQIWDDGKFTYLQGKFEEPPVVYELKDGKGSLINFDFANGLYTVPKLLQNGYVAVGKAKVEFHRQEAN